MARFSFIAFVALTLTGGCTSMRDLAGADIVTVGIRHNYVMCAGICPNIDVTVWPDGRVLVVHHNDTGDVKRFRVSPSRASQFHELLAPYRTYNLQRQQHACDDEVAEEQKPFMLKVTEIAITWGRANDRFVACKTPDNAALREAIRQALWSVDLYISGQRRP